MLAKNLIAVIVILISGAFLAGAEDPPIPADTEIVTTDSGLKYSVLVQGKEGPRPDRAAKVKVHYTGWLEDGKVFDSSVQRGTPAEFKLNQVIPAWTEGVQLMTVGSKYKFTVKPELGYGPQGRPPKIPPNSTLIFEVELLSFEPGPKLPDFHEGNPEAQKKTEAGLIYEPVKEGKGDKPKEGENVCVKYAFWNTDGKLLDCTEMSEREQKYPLGKHGLKLFNEAVVLMNEGARFRFVVPPELAFGERGAGALVAPNTTTIWELELVKILKPLPVPEFSLSPDDRVAATESGLKFEIIKEGTGASPKMGQNVTVHYAGWLEDGTLFDSSYERGDAATFMLGRVIQGWNEGLALMKEGAVYKFTIPANLGYGERGSPPRIPANATLIFYVELIKVEG
jgi:FKBP-type peptidyl-prolyl cis-trans isomerase